MLRDPKPLYKQMETDDKLLEKFHHWRWIKRRVKRSWPSWKSAGKWLRKAHPQRMLDRPMLQVSAFQVTCSTTIVCVRLSFCLNVIGRIQLIKFRPTMLGSVHPCTVKMLLTEADQSNGKFCPRSNWKHRLKFYFTYSINYHLITRSIKIYL